MSDCNWTSQYKVVKFGDIVRQCKESVDRNCNPFERYVEGNHMDSENIHLRRWGNFGNDYVGPAFHRIFRKGQVLYGSRRTYLKKVSIADFDGITANTTFVCETMDQNVFMQELLPFLILTDSFTNHSIRESKGSTNPYVNWSDIAKYKFSIPPLDEQKRVADILWAADDAEEHFRTVEEKLASIRQVYLYQNCLLGHEQNVLRNIDAIACGWPVKMLSDLITTTSKKSKPPHKLNEYLGLEHLEPGRFSNASNGNSESVKSTCNVYNPSEILYGKLRPNLDKACKTKSSGVCTTEILVLNAVNGLSNDLLLHHLHSPSFISWNAHRAYGTKMPRTSLEIIGNYRIPLPPLSIQNQMLETLNDFLEKENAVRQHRMEIRKLKTTLINQLLMCDNIDQANQSG